MSEQFQFQPATKTESRARVALSGPAGSGKTYWALGWADVLAGDGGLVGVVDTERESANLYADVWDFHTLPLAPPYHPDRLVQAIDAAVANDMDVLVVDSLSHFWNGPGGLLEFVDDAKERHRGNTHSAWQEATPIQQRMTDAILSAPIHIIATMRSKTEWLIENEGGRTKITKVGLKPVQRDEMDYEFTLMLEVNHRHQAMVGKTRWAEAADRVFKPEELVTSAEEFAKWLHSGTPLAEPAEVAALRDWLDVLPVPDTERFRDWWRESHMPRRMESLTKPQWQEAMEMAQSMAPEQQEDDDG